MSDKTPEGEDSTEHLAKASDSLNDGISNMSQFVAHAFCWLLSWSEDHPVLSWLVGIPASWLIMRGILATTDWFYTYFFGNNVAASTDIQVQTHPLPLGLSLNILFVLLLLVSLWAYRKIAILRQRINHLEQEVSRS
jgi:hypothetical protein